jgi:ABC-type dipeptide/oligopeptide/nickel transport system permease subunit
MSQTPMTVRSRWKTRRLSDRRWLSGPWRQPVVVLGMVIGLAWLVIVIASPWLTPYDPLAQTFKSLSAPSSRHLFGTDELGRDVFSRVLAGARASIPLTLVLVVGAMLIGVVLGAIAGYFGRVWDEIIMRFVDLFFAFPLTILAMAVAASLGASLRNAVLAGIIARWPPFARVMRGALLQAREADYVSASRLLGASTRRILFVDIARNVAGPIIVLGALEVATGMLLLSGLSFLGLGAHPPEAEWGSMVSEGAQNFSQWWIGTFPGLAILTVAVAFNVIGDALRDVLDPGTNRSLDRRGG